MFGQKDESNNTLRNGQQKWSTKISSMISALNKNSLKLTEINFQIFI